MDAAPLPRDEAARLALLRALDILDTEAEAVFDTLTGLVARLLEVPIAVVSLVDEHRQWFKSRHGMAATQTPRSISFCAHAILGDGSLVVPDAQADARFADSPLVTGEPRIRFYAGVPLRSAQGHALGTLCAIDRVPRRLTEAQLQLLEDLARLVERELLNREAARAARDADAAQRHELEQRVRERTAELERANAELRETMRLRAQTLQALEHSEARLRAVLENALDAFVAVDGEGVVHGWNRQAEVIFGWTREEALDRPMTELFIPHEARTQHAHGLRTDGMRMLNQRLELAARRRDGTTFPCEISVTAMPAGGGERQLFAAFMRDISARKENERLLADAATTDELTGLPNRRSFEAQAAELLERARRHGHGVALLFLDLDRFKSVNDDHGHAVGDAVLKAFGARLRGALRQTDLVARLAGDEFVVLLEGAMPHHGEHVRAVARKIVAAVQTPLQLPAVAVPMRTSIGIAHGDGATPLERLLHDADQALYRAKRQGRGTVCVAPTAPRAGNDAHGGDAPRRRAG